jgi:hypothetical protein
MGQTEISGCCYVKNGELDVVDFACAKSPHVGILHNLSDMHQKLSAGFGLCLDRVPVAYHHFESGLVNFGIECIDVGGTFLQGDGTAGYGVSRRHYRCGRWLEVCSFGYVKGEYGVSSCDGKVW